MDPWNEDLDLELEEVEFDIETEDLRANQEDLSQAISMALENQDKGLLAESMELYKERIGKDAFWHLSLIDAAEMDSNPDAMQAALQAAGDCEGIDPSDLYLRYGKLYYMVGHPEEALEALQKCTFPQESEEDFYKIHLEAYCLLVAQDFENAVEKLEDLLLEYPDYRMYLLGGLCYGKLGRMDLALEYVERALEFREDFSEDYLEVLGGLDFDPQAILDHTLPILDRLAGTRASASSTALLQYADVMELIRSMETEGKLSADLEARFGPYMDPESNHPMICGLLALQAEHENKKTARLYWERALKADWKHELTEDTLCLFFRLQALQELNYDHRAMARYLWKFWDQYENAFYRGELLTFAILHRMKGTMNKMCREEYSPHFETPLEEAQFNFARAKAYYALDKYGKAAQLVQKIWPWMEKEEEFILFAASVAYMVDDEALIWRAAHLVMPHGLMAFYLLEFYDLREDVRSCRKIQRQMRQALKDEKHPVPEADFYKDYLREFQRRHRR